MILCTMPECQTTEGCLCQRRGIIYTPPFVPSPVDQFYSAEIERLTEKVSLHSADAKTAWAECDLLRSELANARNTALEAAKEIERVSSWNYDQAGEIEILRSALEPFVWADETLETILFGEFKDDRPMTFTIPIGALRRARAALKAEGESR